MLGIRFSPGREEPAILTFNTLRKAIGLLGMALPVILFAWSALLTEDHFLLDSISSYYHTNMRDLFVGILCAVSLFLFSYHGYDVLDFVAFKIAAFAALGVAFFPAFIKSPVNPEIHIAPNVSGFTNAAHYAFAGTFFVTLALVSIFLFTKTDENGKANGLSAKKKTRNGLYVACGAVMLLCVLCMVVLGILPDTLPLFAWDPVFWVETVALFAFAFSWLVKGALLFGD